MPFTVSHIAAVVPLSWLDRRFALSALAIGSMAPDGSIVLGIDGMRPVTHSAIGMFTFCLPVGLALLVVYHLFLKQPLLYLLPAEHQARLRPYAGPFRWGGPLRFLSILGLLLLGAWTHRALDALTHDGIVSREVGLDTVFLTVGTMPLPYYSLLQGFISVLGLVLLTYWYWTWRRAAPTPQISEIERAVCRRRFMGAMLVLAGAMVLASVWIFVATSPPENVNQWRIMLFRHVAIACLRAIIVLMVAYALVFHLLRAFRGVAGREAATDQQP